ncbi:MAG: XRE family transcriptional regulator [Methanocella sp.]
MSKLSPSVPAKPDVLKWLRENSGWTLEELSKNTEIPSSIINRWENGDIHPTYKDIVKLAEAYKRPTAAFFLPHPLKERPLPHDFRRLPGKQKGFTVKTLRAIRRAQYSQEISNELLENLNLKSDANIKMASLNDNPEEIANRERNQLALTIDDQTTIKSDNEVFKRLRDLIESRNVMVFQFRMEVEELRGFTLLDIKPYTIVINLLDDIRARIFTLLHEYGHILLNEPAFCNPEDPITSDPRGASIETWCNKFAAAFLLPPDIISKEYSKYGITKYRTIANKYKVSYSMTLTRLVSLNLITSQQFHDSINILKMKKEKESPSFGVSGTSADRAAREYGGEYISLVKQNSARGLITYSDALSYLNVKTHHLENIMK